AARFHRLPPAHGARRRRRGPVGAPAAERAAHHPRRLHRRPRPGRRRPAERLRARHRGDDPADRRRGGGQDPPRARRGSRAPGRPGDDLLRLPAALRRTRRALRPLAHGAARLCPARHGRPVGLALRAPSAAVGAEHARRRRTYSCRGGRAGPGRRPRSGAGARARHDRSPGRGAHGTGGHVNDLGQLSLLAIYGAMAAYAVAMVAFGIDLSALRDRGPEGRPRRAAAIAMTTTTLGVVLHAVGVVTRGIAAGRVPWANMYEFTIVFTLVAAGTFLLIQRWRDLRYLGALVVTPTLLALGLAVSVLYIAADGVRPALDHYWLIIHVSVATMAIGIFAVAAA